MLTQWYHLQLLDSCNLDMSATNEKERESIDNWYVPEIMQPFVNQTNKNKKKAKSPELRVLVMIYNFIYYDSNLFFFFFLSCEHVSYKGTNGPTRSAWYRSFHYISDCQGLDLVKCYHYIVYSILSGNWPNSNLTSCVTEKKKKKKASLYNYIMHTD